MQAGLSIDAARKNPHIWLEGCEQSRWRLPNWSSRKKFVQVTFRCPACGLLSFYATQPYG